MEQTGFSEPSPYCENRYYVPDLSPEARPEMRGAKYQVIFVAESPHRNEIEPEEKQARRPLCGVSGRQWWGALEQILEGKLSEDISLRWVLDFCKKHGIVVMNAVQCPLDPGITRVAPSADPRQTVGFSKAAGAEGFKHKSRRREVDAAIVSLRARLQHPSAQGLPIYCLGQIAEWFVREALETEGEAERIQGRLVHPSAWWRNLQFRRGTLEKLRAIFEKPAPSKI